ncbi:MAG: MerR family transcriptional regulator [Alphaproteobacteria bacterium]|nr:MerR family transcriptional regulator [Alphaproteobacteria bacterium]
MENEYFASIKQVSKQLNIPAHTLRYWEKQFPVAIKPTTGAGGHRYYRPETVDTLVVIKDLLYNRGMTIAGVKKMLLKGELPTSADIENIIVGNVGPNNDIERMSPDIDSVNLAIDMLQRARSILTGK